MVLIIFWFKIAVNRVFNLFKASPLLIVWTTIVAAAFIYASVNNFISVKLDDQTLVIIIFCLFIFSLFASLKNFNAILYLIKYSKSKYCNRYIYFRLLIKRALLNNVLFIIFSIIAFNSMTNKIYFIVMPGIMIFSITLSFVIMYLKICLVNRRIKQIKLIKLKMNPVIKAAVYDYLPSVFTVILSFSLALAVITGNLNDINYFMELENQSFFFILMTIIFSVGFMGIIDSVPEINWKFQAIISPNNFKYHIKRTMFFSGRTYILLLIVFVVIGSIINWILLIKYLYCIFILFLTTILIAFTISHILIKHITFLLFIAITVWISTMPVVFLLALLIPILITFVKAKNEYREWSLL